MYIRYINCLRVNCFTLTWVHPVHPSSCIDEGKGFMLGPGPYPRVEGLAGPYVHLLY